MIRDAMFATGAVLSASTQLRPGELPVGLGEILLALWLGMSLFAWAARPSLVIDTPLKRLGAFWLAIVVSLCIGAIVGMAIETFFDVRSIIHDVIAYTLMLGISCALVVDLSQSGRRRRMAWMIAVVAAVSCLAQLANALGAFQMTLFGAVEPWFFDRLRGWSKDPNQLGFLAAVMMLVLLHLAETAPGRQERTAAAGMAAFFLAIGLMTRSDTFIVSMLAGTAVMLALKVPKWLAEPGRRLGLRPAAVMICALVLPLMVASIVPVVPTLVQRAHALTAEVYDQENQGETRLKLWQESIEKGLESLLLGFGPGPHLTAKSWKRPPPDKFESHNAPLHLLTQGGLLAVLALLWLFGTTFFQSMRAGLPALAGLAIGFLVFSMFHVVYRHPLFWFGIALCLLEATAASRAAAPRGTDGIPTGAPTATGVSS